MVTRERTGFLVIQLEASRREGSYRVMVWLLLRRPFRAGANKSAGKIQTAWQNTNRCAYQLGDVAAQLGANLRKSIGERGG